MLPDLSRKRGKGLRSVANTPHQNLHEPQHGLSICLSTYTALEERLLITADQSKMQICQCSQVAHDLKVMLLIISADSINFLTIGWYDFLGEDLAVLHFMKGFFVEFPEACIQQPPQLFNVYYT